MNHVQHTWKFGCLIGYWVHTSNLVNIQAVLHIKCKNNFLHSSSANLRECEVSSTVWMRWIKHKCFQPQWFCSVSGRQHHGELSGRVSAAPIQTLDRLLLKYIFDGRCTKMFGMTLTQNIWARRNQESENSGNCFIESQHLFALNESSCDLVICASTSCWNTFDMNGQ